MSHDTPNIAAVNHVAQVMSASLEYHLSNRLPLLSTQVVKHLET